MLKVVLVEDEVVIREGIRDIIPWEQYGYRFVGEAGDGEMALSVIRQTRPDVLITDIKMPFMDGLSLSKIVGEEFPRMKIVIISGYDDFEYARQAIEVGVDQYLLKPITKLSLKKVLLELKEKIEQEMVQQDYQAQYQNEMHEYEQFNRRRFFEKMLEGELSVKEIYEESAKQGIELTASSYNLLFFSMSEKEAGAPEEQTRTFLRKQDEVLHYFLRHPQFVLFSWNVNCYGVLIKAENEQIAEQTQNSLNKVQEICTSENAKMDWYVAVGKSVERLSMLPECYQSANHNLAYRFILQNQHVLTEETLSDDLATPEEKDLQTVDSAKMDPEIIKEFLSHGTVSEIHDFVTSYLRSIQEPLKSRMFRDYIVLNIRFTIIAYVESLGSTQEEHINLLDNPWQDMHLKPEEVDVYFEDMLQAALQIREKENDYLSGKVLRRALDYIDHNYDNESISLNSVASEVEASANYLSAIFSQNMQKTFVEYITEKRMGKAKKLLRSTEKSSGEIAAEVGYKDPHYFSFVFKKTQGCSPREYRNTKK